MTRRQALDLPEIRSRVGTYLNRQELLRCVLVSADWHSSFTPYLYRIITFGPRTDLGPAPLLSSLSQYRHHIQELDFSVFSYEVLASLRGCTTLHSLKYRQVHFQLEPRSQQEPPRALSLLEQTMQDRWTSEEVELNRLIELDRTRLNLECWRLLPVFLSAHGSTLQTIHLSDFDPYPSTELWEAIANTCSNLEVLHLCALQVPHHAFGVFVQACSRAREVTMRAVQLPSDLSPHTYTPSQWLPRMLQRHLQESGNAENSPSTSVGLSLSTLWSKTRRLRVYGMQAFSVDAMTLFTSLFPNLEDLSWWDTRVPVNHPRLLCVVASQGIWPQLNSLELQSRGLEDQDLALLIGTMTRIEKILVEESGFGIHCFRALMLRDSLVFEGLRELRLGRSENLTGAMACRILENCPKLEQFSSLATISFLDLMVQSPTDGEARPWICLGLRNLTIKFDLGTPEILQKETSPMDEGFFKKTIPLARSKMACLTRRNTGLPGKTLSDYDLKDRSRIVFGQLARLTRLEVLNISGSECCHDDGTSRTPQQRDLQFRSGYGLTMLDQLKQLHTIGFKRTDQILARKEIDWMLVNWPLLRYVEGQLNPVQSIHESLLAMLRNRKVGVGY